MRWLTDPFTYDFFTRAFVAGIMAGAMCAALGAYVVVRRMSYIAHGLSHAVIGGAAVAGVLQINVLLGAGLWAFITALLIERVSRRRGLYADTAIGVVTTASFALGIAIISAAGRWQRNLDAFLVGNMLGVQGGDVVLAAVVLVLTAGVIFAFYRPLLFVTFDPEVASTHGLSVPRYEIAFAVLLTAGVVASMRVLGVLLVAAAVVIPPATARLLTDRFEVMLPLATGIGAVSMAVGLHVSWHLDIASGPAVVLVQAAAMATALAWSAIARSRASSPRAQAGGKVPAGR